MWHSSNLIVYFVILANLLIYMYVYLYEESIVSVTLSDNIPQPHRVYFLHATHSCTKEKNKQSQFVHSTLKANVPQGGLIL